MNDKPKNWCLGFCFTPQKMHVLMIRKNGGPFPGKWNGLGGNINPGEDPSEAMVRELEEEANVKFKDIREYGKLGTWEDPNGDRLHVFYFVLINQCIGHRIEHEEGRVEWLGIHGDRLLDVTNSNLAGSGNVPYFIEHSRHKMLRATF